VKTVGRELPSLGLKSCVKLYHQCVSGREQMTAVIHLAKNKSVLLFELTANSVHIIFNCICLRYHNEYLACHLLLPVTHRLILFATHLTFKRIKSVLRLMFGEARSLRQLLFCIRSCIAVNITQFKGFKTLEILTHMTYDVVQKTLKSLISLSFSYALITLLWGAGGEDILLE
jgi:hypothetical protein